MHVNLLPFAFQRKLLIRKLVRKWSGAWLTCLVAVGLFNCFEYVKLKQKCEELNQSEIACSATRAVVASNLQLEQRLASMTTRRDELTRLEADKDALAALAVVSQAVRTTGGKSVIESLQFHEPKHFAKAKPSTPPAAGQSTVPVPGGTITINGTAADDEAVAALIESIHSVPLMQRVELRSSSMIEIDGVEGRRFEIVCRYGGKP